MQAERIRFSGIAPIPRLSLFPRFQRLICMGKYFRENQVLRFQRFPDSRGFTVRRYIYITKLQLFSVCLSVCSFVCPLLG